MAPGGPGVVPPQAIGPGRTLGRAEARRGGSRRAGATPGNREEGVKQEEEVRVLLFRGGRVLLYLYYGGK